MWLLKSDSRYGQDRGDSEGVSGREAPLGLQGAADNDSETCEPNEPGQPEPCEGFRQEWDREDDDRHVEPVRPQRGSLPFREDENGARVAASTKGSNGV